MDEISYDEFGNYIGPEIDSETEGNEDIDLRFQDNLISVPESIQATSANHDGNQPSDAVGEDISGMKQVIVLHEDKQYYPEAQAIYGDRVKVSVQEEDFQHISQPIVEPSSSRRFDLMEHDDIPQAATSATADDRNASSSSHAWRPTEYNQSFMEGLMRTPSLIRHVAVIGHFHHGKTIFLDTLVQQTHQNRVDVKSTRHERFTDVRHDEQERGMSIKATPISLVLPNLKEKSYLINFIDTPGHPNFVDEVTAALRICDGALIVVDILEGMTLHLQHLIQHAIQEGLDLTLVINKMDRLILELKLPPVDAYYKIRHVLDQINLFVETLLPNEQSKMDTPSNSSKVAMNQDKELLVETLDHQKGGQDESCYDGDRYYFSPESGNVLFASGEHGWSFSLQQFAKFYFERSHSKASPSVISEFSKRLWGPIYYVPETRTFTTHAPSSRSASLSTEDGLNFDAASDRLPEGSSPPRRDDYFTFIEFILEPIYKLYAQVVGEDVFTLTKTLQTLQINLTTEQQHFDVLPLLSTTLRAFFGRHLGLVNMLVEHVSTPVDSARRKIPLIYTGALNTPCAQSMMNCDPNGPLMIQVTKLYPKKYYERFHVLGRVFSGQVKVGDQVQVLGETFQENEEDLNIELVKGLSTLNARYLISHTHVQAGNWILLDGVDDIIVKTATITYIPSNTLSSSNQWANGYRSEISSPSHFMSNALPVSTFRSLHFTTLPIIKIAVEPLNPSELPKLVEGLRKINKTYPMLITRVEESGERIILGTGELYLDSVMYDLRRVFTDIEIKVAEPVVTFSETVVETSSIKCYAETPNKMNKVSMIAEPLEKGIASDIESGKLSMQDYKMLPTERRQYLKLQYGWDAMMTRNIWAFGPEPYSPNVLINDTLPSEVSQSTLNHVKDYMVRGFNWATREGPLCEEPIRNVKFKLIQAQISNEPSQRSGTQMIPVSRRVAYSAFLTATPRLMEPIYVVDIVTPHECLWSIERVLSRRRGHVVSEKPKPGTPLYVIKAYLPCIDSFGFETDLRTHTQGQAFCLSTFDHWALVPGNPLDSSIVLKPLEPAPAQHLARDFMLKTRRRKGLGEDISISKFFDEDLLSQVQEVNIDLFHI